MFNLNLNEDEVVLILQSLSMMPSKIAAVSQKVQEQAVAQKQIITGSPAATVAPVETVEVKE